MNRRIAHIAIVVKDYDEAIEFYTTKLGFVLVEDTKLSDTKRWVKVTPLGSGQCSILLAKASNESQEKSIGNQTGGRVGFFLHTDDITRDYKMMIENGIKFLRLPEEFDYGIAAVFEDLYGNKWDIIQPNSL